MNVSQIIKPEQISGNAVNISYVNTKKEIVPAKIELDPENKISFNSDADLILLLNQFKENTKDFLGFFHKGLPKIEPEALTTQFVMNLAQRICKYKNEYYLMEDTCQKNS